jgi:hypothetical protein
MLKKKITTPPLLMKKMKSNDQGANFSQLAGMDV